MGDREPVLFGGADPKDCGYFKQGKGDGRLVVSLPIEGFSDKPSQSRSEHGTIGVAAIPTSVVLKSATGMSLMAVSPCPVDQNLAAASWRLR